MLLIAERAALLSGRDDEFVAVVLMGFTGMRWGELVGLETQYVRLAGIRVERQLYELDNGQLHWCPPKDESRRLVLAPGWLVDLVKDHIAAGGRLRVHAKGSGTSSPAIAQPTPAFARLA